MFVKRYHCFLNPGGQMLRKRTKFFKLVTRVLSVIWICTAAGAGSANADSKADFTEASSSSARAGSSESLRIAADGKVEPVDDKNVFVDDKVEPAAARAKKKPAVQTAASLTAGKTSRLDILFGGSLCPVCLVAFQRRLSDTPGVINARVESLDVVRAEHSGHPPKRAHAIVDFAPDKITKSELETIVRQNDFQFIKAQELPATNR
jgi:hypothetical protein